MGGTKPPISFSETVLGEVRMKKRSSGKLIGGLISVAVLLSWLISVNTAQAAQAFSSGDHNISFNFGGRERGAIVHVPARAIEMRNIPVVLNFHGGGGHAENEKEYSLMDALADREAFMVVYPNGT